MKVIEVIEVREKPLTAVQVTLENMKDVCEYIKDTTGASAKVKFRDGSYCIYIVLGRAIALANIGDWVLGETGQLSILTDKDFKERYRSIGGRT